jgi:hypothetical protein
MPRWRKAVAAIADFLHPLGYRTASGTASPKRRDNADSHRLPLEHVPKKLRDFFD